MKDDVKGVQSYLARISLSEAQFRKPGGKPLVPGMPAEILIETDRRSVLTYLTMPLTIGV